MFNDRTAKFLLLAGLVLCVGGAFAPNWIVNQFMFGFSRALAILGFMVLWRTGLVSFGHAFYLVRSEFDRTDIGGLNFESNFSMWKKGNIQTIKRTKIIFISHVEFFHF